MRSTRQYQGNSTTAGLTASQSWPLTPWEMSSWPITLQHSSNFISWCQKYRIQSIFIVVLISLNVCNSRVRKLVIFWMWRYHICDVTVVMADTVLCSLTTASNVNPRADFADDFSQMRLDGAKPVHDDVIKWRQFPRSWTFVRGIPRSPVNSPHKGQWRGASMFPLIYAWMNVWANNRQAGDLRDHRAHYDVTVVIRKTISRASWAASLTEAAQSRDKESNFGQIWIRITNFSSKKMHLNVSSAKLQPIYSGLTVLMPGWNKAVNKSISLPFRVDQILEVIHCNIELYIR